MLRSPDELPEERHPITGGPYPTASEVRAWRRLLEVHAVVMTDLARVMRTEHDLSISDIDALFNIAPDEECRHGDLSSRVVITRTALTRLLDRLAARGLVERSPDPCDLRGTRVRLTPTGEAVRAQALATHDRLISRALAPLPGSDTRRLESLLARIADAHPSPSPSPPPTVDRIPPQG